MSKEGWIGLLVGFLIGVPVAYLIFKYVSQRSASLPSGFPLKNFALGVKAIENIEEWEMKELKDGTIKITVHRRVEPKNE